MGGRGTVLNLNGNIIHGPDRSYLRFDSEVQIVREIRWTGTEWGEPRLVDWMTNSDIIFTDIQTLDDIPVLVDRYPEIAGVNISGSSRINPEGFTFRHSYTFDVTQFPVQIFGNHTTGAGDEATAVAPVIVDEGVTVTIGSGVTVSLFSDDPTLSAIIGAGSDSRLVVESGATVVSVFDDSSLPQTWASGTYRWSQALGQWERER